MVLGGFIQHICVIYEKDPGRRNTMMNFLSSLFSSEPYERCSHGARLGRCTKCFQEEKQRETAKWAEQQRIYGEVKKLRRNEAYRLGQSIVPSLDELRRLTPQKFENEIASLFVRLGYEVRQTPYTNDHGRDAILKKDEKKYLLECKRYDKTNLVGRPALQKFRAAIVDDKAVSGFFVTTSAFTLAAQEYAKKLGIITLIDGTGLLYRLAQIKPPDPNGDRYWGMCSSCGRKVEHNIRSPKPALCSNGHSVEPSLDIGGILGDAPIGRTPNCVKCGVPMRLINGTRGRFWGCSQYPKCRSTQRWIKL